MHRRLSAVQYCFSGLLMVLAFSSAYGGEELDRLLQSFASLKQHEAGFIEAKHSSILTQVLEARGRLKFEAPDKLIKETLRPMHETLVADGNTLQMERVENGKSRIRSTSLRSAAAIAPFIIGLRATFSGDRKQLEEYFKVLFVGDVSRWRLQLQPRNTGGEEEDFADGQISKIEISGSTTQISEINVSQANGDWTKLTLKYK